ncbi:aminodeoxychorismate synthase component 1 [Gallaecimonas sp. GXIMD4217]|uniref:aminodeoxychorismate synthase component 1 n=1 Tax=Gallaecimonas sp. GXIMD4217 TaxID=3131927 RepID=UPI00311AD539
MELTRLPLPYLDRDALVARFAPLAHQSWAILLDSASESHPDSRYSLLSAEPRWTLESRGSEVRIQGDCRVQAGGPLETLKAMMAAWPQIESELPFATGALGLLGYDLGRQIERLPALAKDDIPLPELALGFYDWALISDHQQQQSWLIALAAPEERLAWLDAQCPGETAPFALTGDWQANMTRAEYGARFDRVQAYLKSGDCYQINLAQRFSAPYEGDEWQAYLKLRTANQAPFSAFLRLDEGAVLSISPERFLRLKDGQVQTKPIKGTLPRLADPAEDRAQAERLAASPKDRAENVMIVDLLRNDLGRVARPGSVRVPELFAVESFPAVHHLVSTVTSELAEGQTAVDLLAAAFPGGSITGAPKVRAMEIIEELEPHRRSAYCGSIAYLSANGAMDSSIAIRTLVASRGLLHCWAGGGLVADSQVDAEYQETFDKVAKILPALSS